MCRGVRVVASPYARKLAADSWSEHSEGLWQWSTCLHRRRGRPAAHRELCSLDIMLIDKAGLFMKILCI